MSSIIESEAHFVKRAAEVRVSPTSIQALQAYGFTTLGQLAFVVGQPGQVIPDTAWDAWCSSMCQGHQQLTWPACVGFSLLLERFL